MSQRPRLLPILLVLAGVITLSLTTAPSASAKMIIKHRHGWNTWGHSVGASSYTFNVDRGVHGQDRPCEKIESTLPEQKGGFASIYADFSPELYKGKKFEYTAWIKTNKVKGAATLWATADDEDKVLSFDDMGSHTLSGTADWHKYSIILDVPPQSKRLRVGFMLRGGGSAWWKDPVVTQAQANAKSTARPFDPRKFTLYELDSRPQNLTFEDDRFSADDPSGHVSQWAVATENGFAARVDKETELNGKPSVRIDCSVVDPPGFASIYQIFSAKDYRNKRVRLSGYLKAKAVKDWGALFMQVDAPDRILAFDAMEERPVKGTSDWTKVAVVLDVPPKSTKIKIGFLQAGGGTSWLSNCAFDIVDSALSTTGKPVVDDRFPPLKLPLKPDLNIE